MTKQAAAESPKPARHGTLERLLAELGDADAVVVVAVKTAPDVQPQGCTATVASWCARGASSDICEAVYYVTELVRGEFPKENDHE